jgi:multiple sugar transport system substrate-binding protein
MWSPLTGPDGDEMTALATQFSGDNPQGITVQHVAQPEYTQKLNTAAAGGTLPDMTVIRVTDVAEMAARNIIKPMPENVLSIVGGESVAGDFPEDVWTRGEVNGERYSIPLDVVTPVLYYNTELFEQAGITMPTDRPMTREEFEAAADALNKDGVAGVAIGTMYSGETHFDILLRQFGGNLVNEEGTEAAFNSEAGVEALTYLQQLKQKYSPQFSGQGDPEVTAFQQGRAGMVIHGPWHISNLQKLPFTGFAQVPQFGDEYVTVAGSHQLALTTEDPAKQAAAGCWIAWLSENSVQWARAGQVPARNSARESEELASVSAPVAAFAPAAEHVQLLPSVAGLATAVGAEGVGRAVNPVLLGQQTDIQAALDQAAQRSTQLIQQNAQQYGSQ